MSELLILMVLVWAFTTAIGSVGVQVAKWHNAWDER